MARNKPVQYLWYVGIKHSDVHGYKKETILFILTTRRDIEFASAKARRFLASRAGQAMYPRAAIQSTNYEGNINA